MTERIGNITIICEEPDAFCQDCGKKDELRPYGKGGIQVCWDCAMKNPVEAEIRMHKYMFGDDLTPEQAQKYINIRKKKSES